MVYCKNCGKEIDSGSDICASCNSNEQKGRHNKKSWFRRHPIWTGIIGVFLFFIVLSIFIPSNDTVEESKSSDSDRIIQSTEEVKTTTTTTTTPTTTTTTVEIKEEEKNQIEVSMDELYSIFSDYSELSEIQKEELYEAEYKGKIIKTSIYADTISKASLSTQYVVKEMLSPYSCIAKAFFPSSEKDKLLNTNIGDTIIFTGRLIDYDFGFASCLEFSNSKVLEIKK